MRVFVGSLAIVFAVSVLRAEDICVGAGGSADTLACAERELGAAESTMNSAYDKVVDRIERYNRLSITDERRNGLKELLAQSQQEWFAWRTAHCAFEGESTFGESNWPAANAKRCEVTFTRKRAEYLNTLFTDPWNIKNPLKKNRKKK